MDRRSLAMLSRLMPGMEIASLVVIGVLVALLIVLSSSNWPSTEGVIVASSYKKNSYSNTSSPVVEGYLYLTMTLFVNMNMLLME